MHLTGMGVKCCSTGVGKKCNIWVSGKCKCQTLQNVLKIIY